MTQGNWELNLEANVVFGNDTQLVGNTSLRDKRKQLRILYYHTFHFCVFIFCLIPSFCCVLFFSVFIIFVFFYGFSWSKVVFFGSGAFFFCFIPQTFILQSIHTSDVRGIQQLEKIQNGGGRDVFRRQSCINNRYILSF